MGLLGVEFQACRGFIYQLNRDGMYLRQELYTQRPAFSKRIDFLVPSLSGACELLMPKYILLSKQLS